MSFPLPTIVFLRQCRLLLLTICLSTALFAPSYDLSFDSVVCPFLTICLLTVTFPHSYRRSSSHHLYSAIDSGSHSSYATRTTQARGTQDSVLTCWQSCLIASISREYRNNFNVYRVHAATPYGTRLNSCSSCGFAECTSICITAEWIRWPLSHVCLSVWVEHFVFSCRLDR